MTTNNDRQSGHDECIEIVSISVRCSITTAAVGSTSRISSGSSPPSDFFFVIGPRADRYCHHPPKPFFDMDSATARRLIIVLGAAALVIGIYDLDHGLNRLDAPVIGVSMLVIATAIFVMEWAAVSISRASS